MQGVERVGAFPLPDDSVDVAEFIRALRAVKLWAEDPSLEVLRRRTGVPTSTLHDAFNAQRRQLPSLSLVRTVIRACGANSAQVAHWERVWRSVREHAGTTRLSTVPPTDPDPMASSDASGGPGLGTVGSTADSSQDEWVPRQLPPDPVGFSGRDAALAALSGRSGPAPVTVVTGTAGVGKTALAVHWAHRNAEQYPDGQLYLDLRGHSGDRTITPAEALSLLLQSLGVPGERIPVDLHLLTGLYRSALAGRRVLVVLDNVVDAAQVRPLLPSGSCHALITSRDALSSLVFREGATRITLNTLPVAESVELLTTHLGPDRVGAEPDDIAELAGLCAHLPLALRVVAANLAARPHQSIADAVRELQGSDLLGHLFVVGDPESAVEAAFNVSYRSLPVPVQQLFRLLGLVPGREVDRAATAVLLDRDPGDLVPELDELLAAHLLFESSPGRYRSHDLLTLYARRRADDEPASVRDAVVHRLLSWYMLNIDAATTILSPVAPADRTELSLVGTAPGFSGIETAISWLRAELPNLTKAVIHAAEHGPAPFAWHLAQGLGGFLHSRASGVEHLTIARAGLQAAEAGDHALGHHAIGVAAVSLGDLRTAREEFDSARQQFAHLNHTQGIAGMLGMLSNIGYICLRLGDIDQAVKHFDEALDIGTSISPTNEAPLLDIIITKSNLATAHRIRGNHIEALGLDAECLAYAQRVHSDQFMAIATTGLAMTHLDLGEPATAQSLLLQAHSAAVRRDSDPEAYDALAGLVLVCARTGRLPEASMWIGPLRELLERGVPSYKGDDRAYCAIVEANLAADRLDEAIAVGESALQEYDQAGHRLTAMRLRILLGRGYAAQGQGDAARGYWESALPYAVEQSLPDRVRIEALLGDLSWGRTSGHGRA